MNGLLALKNVSKSYKNIKTLDNINLSVTRGDKIIISGTNGSGKSTLIRIIAVLHIYGLTIHLMLL